MISADPTEIIYSPNEIARMESVRVFIETPEVAQSVAANEK